MKRADRRPPLALRDDRTPRAEGEPSTTRSDLGAALAVLASSRGGVPTTVSRHFRGSASPDFYTRCTSVEALALHALDLELGLAGVLDLARRQHSRWDSVEASREVLADIVAAAGRAGDRLASLLSSTDGETVSRRLGERLSEQTIAYFDSFDPRPHRTEIASSFLGAGIAAAITCWMRKPQITEAQLVDELLSLLPHWVNPAAQL